MKELSEIIKEKTSEMISSGKVEEIIAQNIETSIKAAIEESLRSYSDFGKSLKSAVNDAIACDQRQIELPAYNLFVQEVAHKKFMEVMHADAADHLEKLIGEVVKPIKKHEKTSVLLEQIKEILQEKAIENGHDQISIDSSYNDDETAIYVKFNDPEYENESVKLTLYNFNHNKENTWHIGYINTNDTCITRGSKKIAGSGFGYLSDLLFKYYAMQTEFEMDEEFEDIYVGID